jgi:integrase
MAVIKRGPTWHYRFNYKGKIHTGPTHLKATAKNRKKAEEFEALERAKLRGGYTPIQSVAFSAAAQSFLSAVRTELKPEAHRRLKTSMAVLGRFFELAQVDAITPADVDNFKAARRARGVKEVTIRHDLHALSSLLQYGRRHGWLESDPLDGVTMPSDKDSVRKKVVTLDEEAKYFAEVARYKRSSLHDVAKLIILTGMRPGEVYRLEWAHVDDEKGTAYVNDSKSAAGRRIVRLVQEARDILAARPRAGRYVFPSPKRPGEPLSRLTVSHKAACAKAGVDFQLYDLRRTFGTRMAAAGASPHVLMKIMGHASLKVTMRHYVHAQPEEEERAFELYEKSRSYSKITQRDGVNAGK